MISQTQSPKNKTELVRSVNRLDPSTKFTVIEVHSMKDKPQINKLFDQHMKKGPFSVLFIEGG